jgi:hypothetical protein
MNGWTAEPGAPWRAEVRKVRTALRELAVPAPDLLAAALEEELCRLASMDPAALPLLAFSPFAGLPGDAGRGPAGGPESAARKAGRAPDLPPEPLRTASLPLARPGAERRRSAAMAAAAPPGPPPVPEPASGPGAGPPARPPEPAGQTPRPPVFSLRPRPTEPERDPGRSPVAAQETVAPRGPGASLSPWPGLEPFPAPEPIVEPEPEGRPGSVLSPPPGLPPHAPDLRSPQESVPAVPQAEAISAMELLGRLADAALAAPARAERTERRERGSGGPPAERSGRVGPAEESLSEDRAANAWPGDAADRPQGAPEVAMPGRARRPAAGSLAAEPATFAKPPLSAPGTALPETSHEIPLAEPPVFAALDAETLADLVNEALVEQARRHGVDLS